MLIALADLTEEVHELSGQVSLADGDVPGPSLRREGVALPRPFEVAVRARRKGDVIHVEGNLQGQVDVSCSRCLGSQEHSVDLGFELRFAEEPEALGGEVPETEDGTCLSAEDLDLSYLATGATALSVSEIVREQVLLDLPVRVLCDDHCRGLCSHCGANRNRDACRCEEEQAEAIDARLAPLQAMQRRLQATPSPNPTDEPTED
ncbi:MAG: DUF177 domain-containing protein [Acidobacteriota bacterium]